MNIIVCGAGRVGYSIAKQLSAQSHSVTIIDQSSEDIQKMSESIDVKGIVGRATFPSVLEKAGAKEADMIIEESLKKDSINKTDISEKNFSFPLKEARENFEKTYLTSQLKKFKGNISKTADFVGMERSALHRKLKTLGIKGIN